MSDLFQHPRTDLLAEARANSVDSFDELQSPAFRGVFSGFGEGLLRGGAKAATATGILAGGLYDRGTLLGQKLGDLLGLETDKSTDVQDAIFRASEEQGQSAVDFWTPRANEVGRVGQVVGGLAEVVLPLAATAGNPTLLVASETANTGKALVDQGVDAGTAGEVAAVSGAATYAGLKVPILGKTLTSRVATGALGNTVLGMASRGAEKGLLTSEGYETQAEPFSQDLSTVSMDALTGILFGGLHHALSPSIDPKLSTSEIDAVLTARNSKSFTETTAPGEIKTPAQSVAHQDVLQAAMIKLSRSQAVDSGAAVAKHEGVEFVDDGRLAENVRLAERVADEEPGFQYEADAKLSPADAEIETSLGDKIRDDYEAAKSEYAAIKETRGGKVLNTDTARELSADYLKDRTKSAAVHEPASAFIKKLYAQKLAEAPKPGEDNLVLFTAGGTGAGKTSAIKAALGPLADRAQIVYDTNMNGFKSGVKKIDQALAAGKSIQIVYTYRDPVKALTEGALTRAMGQEADHGSGRTVPLEEHINTHIGSRETMDRIAAHYAGDGRVNIVALDNTGPRGSTKRVALGSIPKFDAEAYNSLRENATTALEDARATGAISESIYRGFAEQRNDAQAVRGSGGGRTGGGAEQAPAVSGNVRPSKVSALSLDEALSAKPAAETEAPTPEVAALAQLVESNPDLEVITGFDGDGNPVKTTIAEAYEQIRAEHAKAINDTKAYEAAAGCILARGAA